MRSNLDKPESLGKGQESTGTGFSVPAGSRDLKLSLGRKPGLAACREPVLAESTATIKFSNIKV